MCHVDGVWSQWPRRQPVAMYHYLVFEGPRSCLSELGLPGLFAPPCCPLGEGGCGGPEGFIWRCGQRVLTSPVSFSRLLFVYFTRSPSLTLSLPFLNHPSLSVPIAASQFPVPCCILSFAFSLFSRSIVFASLFAVRFWLAFFASPYP